MLFDARTLAGLTEGRIDRTFRRWTVVRPKVGSRFTTSAGVVEVTSIEPVAELDLSEADAYAAGFESRDALLRWTARKGEGDLYRVGIVLAGPDPRIALRSTDRLETEEVATITARLDRMDRAADRPWTRQVLEQIRRQPGRGVDRPGGGGGRGASRVQAPRPPAQGIGSDRVAGHRLPALPARGGLFA